MVRKEVSEEPMLSSWVETTSRQARSKLYELWLMRDLRPGD